MKNRHVLRKSDLENLREKLKPVFGEEVEKTLQGRIETAETEEFNEVILADNEPILIKKEGIYIPLIKAAEKLSLKRITVDMGAVPHISDGAHIMAPGIVEVDENIEREDLVAIEDKKNRKIIAIAKALRESSSLMGEEGKVAENVHTVGDKIWEFAEKF
ncbi:MAG: PUA domain-containing protein [Candidatus Hadarchaeia archaeon]